MLDPLHLLGLPGYPIAVYRLDHLFQTGRELPYLIEVNGDYLGRWVLDFGKYVLILICKVKPEGKESLARKGNRNLLVYVDHDCSGLGNGVTHCQVAGQVGVLVK